MRLLFAKTLMDDRSAIVIQTPNGNLVGGVVWLTAINMSTSLSDNGTNDTLELKLVWQWWKYIQSPEDFERKREWESMINTGWPKLEAPK